MKGSSGLEVPSSICPSRLKPHPIRNSRMAKGKISHTWLPSSGVIGLSLRDPPERRRVSTDCNHAMEAACEATSYFGNNDLAPVASSLLFGNKEMRVRSVRAASQFVGFSVAPFDDCHAQVGYLGRHGR